MRSRALSILVIATLTSGGCDRKPAASNTPADASSSPASTSAPTDWSRVAAAPVLTTTEATCRLARLADFVAKGGGKGVRISFAGGKATAPDGASCPVTPEEWKGILDLISRSTDGRIAARALPAAEHDYKDGRGRVRSHAFNISRDGDSVLILDVVKPLDRDSNG